MRKLFATYSIICITLLCSPTVHSMYTANKLTLLASKQDTSTFSPDYKKPVPKTILLLLNNPNFENIAKEILNKQQKELHDQKNIPQAVVNILTEFERNQRKQTQNQ